MALYKYVYDYDYDYDIQLIKCPLSLYVLAGFVKQ